MRQVSNSPETGIKFRHILSYHLRRDINSPGTDIAVEVQWWRVSPPPHLHRTVCYPDVKHWPQPPSAPKEERNFVSVFPDYDRRSSVQWGCVWCTCISSSLKPMMVRAFLTTFQPFLSLIELTRGQLPWQRESVCYKQTHHKHANNAHGPIMVDKSALFHGHI